MVGKFDIVAGPSPRERGREQNLSTVAIRTTLGAYYVLPDLLQEHFREMLTQLDMPSEKLIVRNVSEATLLLPMRIIEGVYLVEGDISMGMSVLWQNPAST